MGGIQFKSRAEIEGDIITQGFHYVCLENSQRQRLFPYNTHGKKQVKAHIGKIWKCLDGMTTPDGVYYVMCRHSHHRNNQEVGYGVKKGDGVEMEVTTVSQKPIHAPTAGIEQEYYFLKGRVAELEAREKVHLEEIRRLNDEVEFMSEEYEDEEEDEEQAPMSEAQRDARTERIIEKIGEAAKPLLEPLMLLFNKNGAPKEADKPLIDPEEYKRNMENIGKNFDMMFAEIQKMQQNGNQQNNGNDPETTE